MISEPIFDAIENGDVSGLKALLSQGEDPNQVRKYPLYLRPIHASIVALANGEPKDMFDLIVASGADLNATYPGLGGGTPLLVAIGNELPKIVKELIGLGADPNVCGQEGDSPLRYSVKLGDMDMIHFLLASGAASTIDDYGGFEHLTALGLACRSLNKEAVIALLNAGTDVRALDLDGKRADDRLPVKCVDQADLILEIRQLLGHEH